MAHLSNFGVGNFRSFKDLYNFEFRPITILTGTNSSGKSSLIKALLLLKGSIEKNLPPSFKFSELNFDPGLNIGNYSTTKNKSSSDSSLYFELPFRFPSSFRLLTLRVEYQPMDSAVSAQLVSLKLIDPISEEEILTYNAKGDRSYQSTFKFSSLWSIFREAGVEIEKREELERERSGIYSRAQMGKDGELVFTEEDQQRINEIQKKLQNNSTYVDPSGPYGDDFNSSLIYFQDFGGLKVKPILNYLFLYRLEWISSNLNKLFPKMADNERLDLFNEIKKNQEKLRLIAKNQNKNMGEIILEWELQCMDKLGLDTIATAESWEIRGPLDNLSFFHHDFNDPFQYVLKSQEEERDQFPHRSQTDLSFELLKDSHIREFAKPDMVVDSKFLSRIFADIPTEIPFDVPMKNHGLDNQSFFIKKLIIDGFDRMINKLSDAFTSIDYIPSVRTKVDRIYRLGTKESTLHELLFEFVKVKPHPQAMGLLNFFVREFEIADRVEIQPFEDSSGSKIVFYKNDKPQELADFGYGISQIIPVLLKIAIIINKNTDFESVPEHYPNPSILIIEEPETNLHPALQSKLANLFVRCYNSYNIQFIIETHSEYLIRKLQYIIANKNHKLYRYSANNGVIYYFNDPDKLKDGEQYVKKINFNDDGTLTDEFGTGFFDEADNLAISLFNLNHSQRN